MPLATTGKNPVTLTKGLLLLASISAVSLVIYSHQVHDVHHESYGGRSFGFHGQGDAITQVRTKRVNGQGQGQGHGHIDWHGQYHGDAESTRDRLLDGEGEEGEPGEEEDEEEEGEEDRGRHEDEHEHEDDSGHHSLGKHHDGDGGGGVASKGGGNGNKHKATAHVLSRQWVSQVGRSGSLAYNHMAMVSRLKNGTLLSTWQASSMGEGKPDQALRFAHGEITHPGSDAPGIAWHKSFPAPIAGPGDAKGGVVWSPVTHVDNDGRIFLFYTQSTPGCRAPGGDIKLVVCEPDGVTWSEPRIIYGYADGRINKVIANKLVVTSSGAWVLPFWREMGPCRSSAQAEPTAGVLVSKDNGLTWKPHGHISHASTWLIEQTVVELKGHGGSDPRFPTLMMLCRTAANHVFKATSKDDGKSWSTAEAINNLPNPNAKIAALGGLGGGGDSGGGNNWIVMVLNDHKELPQPYRRCRTKLRVVGSKDGGKKWERLASIEETLKPGLRYHYPTIMAVEGDVNGGGKGSLGSAMTTGDFVLMFSTFFMKGFSKGGVKEGINSVMLRLTLP